MLERILNVQFVYFNYYALPFYAFYDVNVVNTRDSTDFRSCIVNGNKKCVNVPPLFKINIFHLNEYLHNVFSGGLKQGRLFEHLISTKNKKKTRKLSLLAALSRLKTKMMISLNFNCTKYRNRLIILWYRLGSWNNVRGVCLNP